MDTKPTITQTAIGIKSLSDKVTNLENNVNIIMETLKQIQLSIQGDETNIKDIINYINQLITT